MSNKISLPELMPPQSDGEFPIFRKRKRFTPKRMRALIAVIAICVAVGAFFIFNPSKRPISPPPEGDITTVHSTESTHSSDTPTSEPPVTSTAESLPVLLPLESEPITNATEASTPKETEPQSDSVETTLSVPNGAFSIKEVSYPTQRADIINYTAHTFNVDALEVMTSAVIVPSGNGPTVLIISTHTSECYLPASALYYHPDEHKTHSDNPAENMTAVAKAFYDALTDCGINAIHITVPCDSDGSSKAYINARNEIARVIAQHPEIKYVIDIERAIETDSDGNLLRTSVILGSKQYAPIKLTVSGGGSLGYSRICQNLSFALKLNAQINEQSPSLTRPVQIADAVYTDGSTPRTLKIEIGNYTSTLDEAVSSASLLGELFALLLDS